MQRRLLLIAFLLLSFSLISFSQSSSLSKIRTISGYDNNVFNPGWGSAGENLLRTTTLGYADGVSAPAGSDRPNPRTISNTLFAQEGLIGDPLSLSDFCWVWGQFIDHDIGFTPDGEEDASILVPAGDPHFDPMGLGRAVIPMRRNIYDHDSGTGAGNPRQHPNLITAFIDGSAVYGSTEERAIWLRTFEGGKLKTSAGNLLPYNTTTGEIDAPIDVNHPEMDNPVRKTDKIFVAGDVRANENPLLASFHTLFVREHNRWCEKLTETYPDWTDEELYQHARKIVGGLIQAIVYEEWLPAMGVSLPPYVGYNPNTNPQLLNVFSGSAFRLGHTLLNSTIRRMNDQGRTMPEGNISLKDAFFDPTWIATTGSIDPFFKGMATQTQQMMDPKVIDDVRNFLFGPPGVGGLDLAAININRGRERGLPDFNTLRQDFGMRYYRRFDQISSRPEVYTALETLYGDIDNIDSWVGLLAESPMPGALFGETIMAIMEYQFTALRDGDRFYYQNDPVLSEEEKEMIKNTSLQDVIMRNTGVKLMQSNVFKSTPHSQICDNLTIDVSGNVATENGRPLRDVSIFLERDELGVQLSTGADGSYTFPAVAGCTVKGLQVSKEDGVANGVSTVDLILATKHILGAKLLDSPYKIIAADVDRSNSISVIDLVRLRKVILSIYTSFPNNTAWRFIPKDFKFTDSTNPFLDALPDDMSFDFLGGDLNQNFIAIKVGDLNGSVKLEGEQGARLLGAPVALHIADREVQPGEFVEVVLASPGLNKMEGFQFTLDYDETALRFERLEEGDLPNQNRDHNFGVFAFEGAITTTWNKSPEEAYSFTEGETVLFRTHFVATRAGRLSEFISLNDEFTPSEAYDEKLNSQALTLQFSSSSTESARFLMRQNQPNPVSTETIIPFVTPEQAWVTLYITDLNGRAVYSESASFEAGENTWRLNRESLPAAGAYFYTLETTFGRNTKKLFVMD